VPESCSSDQLFQPGKRRLPESSGSFNLTILADAKIERTLADVPFI
jgi:hypothetical protein